MIGTGLVQSVRAIVIVGATCFVLAGCVIPITEGNPSRSPLGDTVPAFIKSGKTTREEVVLQLGEPDAVGANERWMMFGSVKNLGGALVLLPAPTIAGFQTTETRYGRLLLRFDQAGVVCQSTFETQACQRTVLPDGRFSEPPCLDISRSFAPLSDDVPAECR
jgi:hypothetical protein